MSAALNRQRQAALNLHLDADARRPRPPGDERVTARSLAEHRAVARRLRKPMVHEARHVLRRWRQQGRIDPRHAERWEKPLAMPLPTVKEAITVTAPKADDLRQNSPFASVLSEPEPQRILTEVR